MPPATAHVRRFLRQSTVSRGLPCWHRHGHRDRFNHRRCERVDPRFGDLDPLRSTPSVKYLTYGGLRDRLSRWPHSAETRYGKGL
jgi:hypothetical protein